MKNTTLIPVSPTTSVRRMGAIFFAGALLLSGCGSSEDTAQSAATDESAADVEAETADTTSDITISTGPTDIGDVLVDGAGLSLYGFLPDETGTPTCGGACADAWPPVLLPDAELPAELDDGIFGVVDGVEGGFHLTAGGWPLYRFAGDGAPGDITGQGSGDNWFLVAPDGSLISDESAAPADSSSTYDY